MEEVKPQVQPQEQRLDTLGRKIPIRKTQRQKMLLDRLVAKGSSIAEAMRDVGYSPNTARAPSKVTKSIGFQAICEDLGLTDNLLVKSLVEDIKAKPKNRKAEIELGFKVTGRLKEEGFSPTNQFNFFFQDEQSKKIAERIAKRVSNLNGETGGDTFNNSTSEEKLN